MVCDACDNILLRQKSGSRFSRLNELKSSAQNGCKGCQLVTQSIESFFRDELSNGLGQNCWWMVTAGIRGPGSVALVEHAKQAKSEDILMFFRGSIHMYCVAGQSPLAMDIPIQRHTCRDTSSESVHRLAKSWLEHCDLNHKECAEPRVTALPKRTLFIGQNNDDIKLSENKGTNPDSYICLSHCWGDVQPIRTTARNLAAHKAAISWSSLPKTFQDAVTFTRNLGIKHLWIDSLCIIQDDEEDWASESANMGSIYTLATLTIAAMASKDSNGGCFRSNPREPLSFHLEDPAAGSITVFVTQGLHQNQALRRPPTNYEGSIRPSDDIQSPLNNRGWVFQEKFLSRRIAYFNRYELMWSCKEGTTCECGLLSPEMVKPNRLAGKPWELIIQEYTGGLLTNSKDKLPALSGVAHFFQENGAGHGHYYAGLWERDLVEHLSWGNKFADTSRPLGYRAPSWSWASVDGVVEYYDRGPNPPLYRTVVSSVSCTLSTIDPYGQVSSGHLDLHTLLLPGKYYDHFTLKVKLPWRKKERFLSPIPRMSARLDVNPYVGNEQRPPYFSNLQCAVLRCGEEGWKPTRSPLRLTVLLLQPSGSTDRTYTRIGVAYGGLEEKHWKIFQEMIAETSQVIRIV